jgi:hypothetical protein
LLRKAAGQRSDAKALNLYATALEIDSVAAIPRHQAIADEIAERWQMPLKRYPRTLEQAKLNLVRRFGEAARAMAERHSRDGDLAKPAYRQLFDIGCAEPSYPVRPAVAQEIGAGGDDALAQLKRQLEPDPANGGHKDDRESARSRMIRAWLVPLLAGSATSAESTATARGLLQRCLDPSTHSTARLAGNTLVFPSRSRWHKGSSAQQIAARGIRMPLVRPVPTWPSRRWH